MAKKGNKDLVDLIFIQFLHFCESEIYYIFSLTRFLRTKFPSFETLKFKRNLSVSWDRSKLSKIYTVHINRLIKDYNRPNIQESKISKTGFQYLESGEIILPHML